jgi:phage repressor protein C with HTH and peptisase S24 domain
MHSPEKTRETLAAVLKERGVSFAEISRLIGRNAAYIQQYIKRGHPTRLNEESRIIIAKFLNVNKDTFALEQNEHFVYSNPVSISYLHVEASAGSGSFIDSEDNDSGFFIDKRWLNYMTTSPIDNISTICVNGDSMAPTLLNRDKIIVDHSCDSSSMTDGIFVLRRDGYLMVKRLTFSPELDFVTISSDNALFPSLKECAIDTINIVGKVIGLARSI